MSEQLVLVTGGSGFLGANLIKLLQNEGYRVRTTVRDAGNQKKVEHLQGLCPQAQHPVDIVEADLTNAESWHKAVEGCIYVHHVASPFPLETPKSDEDLIRPAVDGTLNVLKACAAAKTVKRVVVTSSFAAILNKQKSKDESYSEADWINPEDKKFGAYPRSKALAEKAAWQFVEELPDSEKFELSVTNPCLILGPVNSGIPGSSIALVRKLLQKEYPMIPRFCIPVIDVRDVALAHLKCMTLPEAAGHRHLLFGNNAWFKEMADILDKEFRPQGYNVPTYEMPGFILSAASLFLSELRNAAIYRNKLNVENSRMTQVLGITPTPLDRSLLDMAYTSIEKGFVFKTSKYKGPPGTDI